MALEDDWVYQRLIVILHQGFKGHIGWPGPACVIVARQLSIGARRDPQIVVRSRQRRLQVDRRPVSAPCSFSVEETFGNKFCAVAWFSLFRVLRGSMHGPTRTLLY
jgi:hypothetical protein